MVNSSDTPNPAAQAMSSLMDGDLTREAVGRACEQWRRDPESRQRWHAYQLIGDVLRSEDLANTPARDESFLQALRERLAHEPVPFSPQPLPEAPAQVDDGRAVANGVATPPARRSLGWLVAPAAVAAGFVAVAAVMVVTRVMAPTPDAGAVMAVAPQGTIAASGTLVRDAGLDRYLKAHRNLGNGLAVAGGAEHRVQIVFEGR
jgi:sigma-E factor negative regulatory protein RseA